MTFDHGQRNCISEIWLWQIAHPRASLDPKTGLNRSRATALGIRIVLGLSGIFQLCNLILLRAKIMLAVDGLVSVCPPICS